MRTLNAALVVFLTVLAACSGGAGPGAASSGGESETSTGRAPGSSTVGVGTSATSVDPEDGMDLGSPELPDCAEPDWTDPNWFESTGCYYVLDVSSYYFNNWCYRVGSCTVGEPPPGKTLSDMVSDRDTLALVASLQGLVNRGAPTLYLIADLQPDEDWLNLLPEAGIWLEDARRHDLASVEDLLDLFSDHPALTGSVEWDADDPYSLNIAFSLAAAQDLLVVRQGGAYYNETVERFEVAESLVGRFSTKREAYEWVTESQLSTGALAPTLALYSDGWALHQMLEGTFDHVGQSLLSRDYLVADGAYFVGYGVHSGAPDETQSPPAPVGEGRVVLQDVLDVIRERVGPDAIFTASGWPSSEYAFDCNNDGVIDHADQVTCDEWEWTQFLSSNGGVLSGGPAGFYAKESANKSFFRHGPGVDLVVQPPSLTPRELLARGYVVGPPRNHSFEAGVESWTFTSTNSATYDDPKTATQGDHFVQANVSDADVGAGFFQDVGSAIARGHHYSFEIDARIADARGAADVALVVEADGAELCRSDSVVSGGRWRTLSCRFQHVGDDAATARLRVAIDSPNVNVSFDQAVLIGATRMDVDPSRRFVQFFLGDYDFPMAMHLVPVGVHPFPWSAREASIPTGVGLTAVANRDTPPIFAYFAQTKTENQWFVMPDSGAGYLNPGFLPPEVVDDWMRWTASMQRPLGYRTGWVLNGTRWSDVAASNPAGLRIRDIYRRLAPEGIYYNATNSNPQLLDGGLPVVPLLSFFAAGTSVEDGASALASAVASNPTPFSTFRGVFVSEQAVEEVVNQAHANGSDFDVVDPHTFMYLFRAARGESVVGRLSVVAHSLPTRVSTGARVTATVDVRNDGWDIWVPASSLATGCDGSGDPGSGCERIAWGLSGEPVLPAGIGRVPEFEYERSSLPDVVLPGETATVEIEFQAPTEEGSYTFQLDGVKEGVRFFETGGNVPWQKTIAVSP